MFVSCRTLLSTAGLSVGSFPKSMLWCYHILVVFCAMPVSVYFIWDGLFLCFQLHKVILRICIPFPSVNCRFHFPVCCEISIQSYHFWIQCHHIRSFRFFFLECLPIYLRWSFSRALVKDESASLHCDCASELLFPDPQHQNLWDVLHSVCEL